MYSGHGLLRCICLLLTQSGHRGRLRPVMLDAVSVCVQYDVGSYIFCTDDLRHRQHNGRHENYFSNRLQ